MPYSKRLAPIIARCESELVSEWLVRIAAATGGRPDLPKADGRLIEQQCRDLLAGVRSALESAASEHLDGTAWEPVRAVLTAMSRERAQHGYTPKETALGVFSLKGPLFAILRRELPKDGQVLADETWAATELIDDLGLFTIESYVSARQEVILRQQEEMLELSTPVVKLWDGILALPLIGTLDSNRAQVVMESLLQKVVETGSEVAIIDITGVPTVDTLVAQHLLKTVTAARLMGTDCIISGIRPQIAQTIVYLGVDLKDVITKSSLADAFQIALQRLDLAIVKRRQAGQVAGAGRAATSMVMKPVQG
jgi:rsbT co-antagonist protein RsbR